MNRTQINKAADEWLMKNQQRRAVLNVVGELDSNNEPHLSMTVGGNAYLLRDAIFAAMAKHPGVHTILKEAVDEFTKYQQSKN